MMNSVERVAGVDEAGRGPLAGPVVAAAVILPADYHLPGLTDSKKLSEGKRQELEIMIKEQALAWTVSEASVEEIDQINILQATMLAMQRSVIALSVNPSLVLVDGNRAPLLDYRVECIVKGDLTEPCISAASILAKEARDRTMRVLDEQYPEYGFARHKAYPTAQHRAAIMQYGVCPHHRRSFKPVRQALSL